MPALNVVTIQVRDWDAQLAWYRDVFGLSVAAIEDDDRFVMFETGGAMLALATDHPEFSQSNDENRMAPSFYAADLDAEVARLKAAGVTVDPNFDGEGEGYRMARVWDPEGNRLQLFTYGS